jgi:hypothetical protein
MQIDGQRHLLPHIPEELFRRSGVTEELKLTERHRCSLAVLLS